MEITFYLAKERYIRYKGIGKYNELYRKVSESKEIEAVCDFTIKTGIAPTAKDFINQATLMRSLLFNFNQATTSMAALILLKLWDERINRTYKLYDAFTIDTIAGRIRGSSLVLIKE